jgi:hypothetical protein
MTLNKTLALVFTSVLICLLVGLYYVKLSVSESLWYSENSIEYLLLTPDILKNLPVEKIGMVKHYYYSAADGSKPLINAIEMESEKNRDFIETTVAGYLGENGFTGDNPNIFVKDKQQITLGTEKSESNSWFVNITLLEIISG